MTYTTHVVGFSKKMNNVNKDLVIQEPVESIATWQWRATIASYESASSWGPIRSQRISKGNEEKYKVEMNSMNTNDIWDLEVIPNGVKTVGC